MICYLAAPIDAANDTVKMVRHMAKQQLADAGFSVYDPTDAWVGSDDPRQQDINYETIQRCDAMLAVLLPDVLSVGVPLEVMEAKRQGLPVAVVAPRNFLVLTTHNVQQFREIKKAVEFLVDESATDTITGGVGRRRTLSFVGDGTLPAQSFPDDAGMDLFVLKRTIIMARNFADVPHGVSCELPPGVWALLVGRSSAIRKRKLIVIPSVIDTGYRGELFAGCYNVGEERCFLEEGERIAQIVLLPNLTSQYEPQSADALGASLRGAAGFGSTGS